MDPISMLMTALIAGAAIAGKSTVELTVKDAYSKLKDIIQSKDSSLSISMLENDPASKERQKILEQDLKSLGIDNNEEVMHQAEILLKAIEEKAPEIAEEVGLRIEDVKVGASLRIQEIVSRSGVGVEIKRSEITEDIDIGKIESGGRNTFPKP
jgi:hypothetical protein